DKTALRLKLAQQLDAIHKAHTEVGDALKPIVDASYSDVVASADNMGKTGDRLVRGLIDEGLVKMRALVQLGSEANLVTGLLTAGALTTSPSILTVIEDRFTASARRAKRELARFPDDEKYNALRKHVAELVALAEFKGHAAAAGNEAARLQNV